MPPAIGQRSRAPTHVRGGIGIHINRSPKLWRRLNLELLGCALFGERKRVFLGHAAILQQAEYGDTYGDTLTYAPFWDHFAYAHADHVTIAHENTVGDVATVLSFDRIDFLSTAGVYRMSGYRFL